MIYTTSDLNMSCTMCFEGLRLTLNVESEEYIGMFSPSVGARITIHPRKEKPFPDYKGFNVAPGFETNVALAMVSENI